jgi:hypothetical protein
MTAGYYFVAMGLLIAFGSQWAKRFLDDKTNSFRNGYVLLALFTVFGAGIGAAVLGVVILIIARLATA